MTAQAVREGLIAAGYRAAVECRLAELTAERIAAAAGLDSREFPAHFGSLKEYLLALQQHFLDDLRGKIVVATMHSAPGAERIRAATMAFLDGCLAQRPLRSWLIELRATDPEVFDMLVKRNAVYTQLLRIEFESMRMPHAVESARLFFVMTQETALAEHDAGQVLADMRETMLVFLKVAA
jgi:hypothetical protein